jgi:hypothetical protein
MPIAGLTDRNRSFPLLGKLRKGSPKEKNKAGKEIQGKDLTYFRLDSDRSHIVSAFEKHYGKEPTEINVWLPYSTVEENFPSFMEEWKGGGLVRRCTGETIVMEHNPQTNMFSHTERPCPGSCGCKPNGRLMVMVRELFKEGHVGFFMVETHSKNDIITLTANLQAAYALRPNLCGIPFTLRRSPRMVSTPNSDGSRTRREKWLLSIEPDATWVQKQLSEMYQDMMGNTPLPGGISSNLLLEADEDDDFEPIGIPTPSAKTGRQLLKERFEGIMKRTGHTWEMVGAIMQGLLRRDTKAHPPTDEETDQIRNDLYVDWAIKAYQLPQEDVMKALGEAIALYGSDDDENIWHYFVDLLTAKPTEQEPGAIPVQAEIAI